MGVPPTAPETEVTALLRRNSRNHDRAPTIPASVKTPTRRAGETALTASRRVPPCMSQAIA